MKRIKSLIFYFLFALTLTVITADLTPFVPIGAIVSEIGDTNPELIAPADDGSGNNGVDESY